MKMKAVILNGAREKNGTMKIIQDAVLSELTEAVWDAETFDLRDAEVAACMGCFGCWFKTPGVCLINDMARDITKSFVQGELAVFLTPVTFGGYSSELKKLVDRLIPAISPYFMKINGEIHHKPRYGRYPKLAAIGMLKRFDIESERIFKTLVERNAINMHSPAYDARIVLEGEWPDQIRKKVGKCFNNMGVMK